jgi:hypothetical protein
VHAFSSMSSAATAADARMGETPAHREKAFRTTWNLLILLDPRDFVSLAGLDVSATCVGYLRVRPASPISRHTPATIPKWPKRSTRIPSMAPFLHGSGPHATRNAPKLSATPAECGIELSMCADSPAPRTSAFFLTGLADIA